jgi:hypothetical protein
MLPSPEVTMPDSTDNAPRPRPILVTQSVMVAVGAVVTSAGFAGQIPARAAWWIITGYIAIQAGLAFYLQSVTTPVSDPKAADGSDLIPADVTKIVVTRDHVATVTTPKVETLD